MGRRAVLHMKNTIIGMTLVLLVAILGVCQQKVVDPRSQTGSDDIVRKLLPEGFPPRIANLNPAERDVAVRQLQLKQKRATGKRSQEIAFLLAALGSDYQKNRTYLIESLRGCNTPSIISECEVDTGAFLIGLYE